MKPMKWTFVVALAGLLACGGDTEEAQRVPLGEQEATSTSRADWPEGLAEQVDEANAAYANEEYEAAAETYRGLTDQHPEIGTLWFGLYLAETALGNEEAAAAALEKVEELVPGLLQMHDGAGGMMAPDLDMPADSLHQSLMEGAGG